MKKNLKISLLALACFGLSASNKEVSQADFIKNVEAAVKAKKDNKTLSFENNAYLAAALLQNKNSDLKVFLGQDSDDKNLVIDEKARALIVKGKTFAENSLLQDVLKEVEVSEKDLVSKVENYLTTFKEKSEKKSNKKWWIVGGVIASIVVIGAVYYLYSQNQSVDI